MKKIKIGGQAVIEGVMMRSERAFTVAVRKTDGSIKVKEDIVSSLSEKYPILKRPLLRGVVVLFESLVLGISALTYSASEAAEEEVEGELSPWVMGMTIVFALALGIFLFLIVPHIATVYVDQFLS